MYLAFGQHGFLTCDSIFFPRTAHTHAREESLEDDDESLPMLAPTSALCTWAQPLHSAMCSSVGGACLLT